MGLERVAVMSVVTKRTAITIPNPRAPLRTVVVSMDQGTTISAFLISSAIYGESVSISSNLLAEH